MPTASVQVDIATLADAPWLVAWDTHVAPDWVRRCLDLKEYYIARSGAERIGFLRHSRFWGVIPFMDLIYVAPAWRRQGVGSALLEAWRQAMADQGASVLMTSSLSDEPEPQAWHERNGFERAGSLTFGAHQSTPEVFFVKSL
jgi:GNAT superfamily N-acetyltransferase